MKFGFTSKLGMALLLCLAMWAGAEDEPTKPYQHHSVLVVKKIPDTKQAISGLSLRGIESVFVNRKSRKIIFKLVDGETPSATKIWEVAEQLGLGPVRLVTSQGIYTSKPVEDTKSNTGAKKKSRKESPPVSAS